MKINVTSFLLFLKFVVSLIETTSSSSSTINQPYGVSRPHGQTRRVLNQIIKRVNHSAYVTHPVHRDQSVPPSFVSSAPTIRSQSIGRYFCATASTPLSDCWYSNRFYINGKLFTISNPKEHFAVLEPRGGCGASSTVSSTAKDFSNRTFNGKKPGCRVAINAGFFTRDVKVVVNTTTNETLNVRCGSRPDAPCNCLGNIVSQNRVVQSTSLQNVNFGIRNGMYVVGYLTENEVNSHEDPFDQLIAGVIWLVKNGTNFVDMAAAIENPTTQQTSEILEDPNNHRANTFVDVFAARTVIGHDVEGKLKIFQLDGLHGRDRPTRGIGLRILADILIDLGFHNAVNLDGGGSSTTVLEDQMVNYPSDLCVDSIPAQTIRCERPVSSIVCIHDSISSIVPSSQPSSPTVVAPSPPSNPSPTLIPSTPSPKPDTDTETESTSEKELLTANTILSSLLLFSVGMHFAVFYVIGSQQRDLRGCCHIPWSFASQHCCSKCKNMLGREITYSKVERQRLAHHSNNSSSQEVEISSLVDNSDGKGGGQTNESENNDAFTI
jgi:exopolysaccharide biosynthesis protein